MAHPLLAGLPRMNRALLTLSILYTLTPSVSEACSVCFDPNDEARIAFIITTGLLTCVPLIVMWIIIRWFRNRALAFEQEELERISNESILPLPPPINRH